MTISFKYLLGWINFLIFFLFFFFCIEYANAAPEKLEVYFLAENEKPTFSLAVMAEAKADEGAIPFRESIINDTVTCDPANYQHSLFCDNKSKGAGKKMVGAPLEIYVDISSSFRMVDKANPKKSGVCARSQYVEKLRDRCGKSKLALFVFNSRVMQVGVSGKGSVKNEVCQEVGENNKEKLLEILRQSRAKQAVVITDAFELEKSFYEKIKELKTKKTTFHGDKAGEKLFNSDLPSLATWPSLSCP